MSRIFMITRCLLSLLPTQRIPAKEDFFAEGEVLIISKPAVAIGSDGNHTCKNNTSVIGLQYYAKILPMKAESSGR